MHLGNRLAQIITASLLAGMLSGAMSGRCSPSQGSAG
jgi:hypothetical protein